MSHGFGSVVPIVLANGIRLLASAAGALIAIHWFGLGAIGFFAAVAIGFCAFAAMAVSIMQGEGARSDPTMKTGTMTILALTIASQVS
jgi:Zn-dependent M32 family carboxypeptidase